MTLDDKVKAVVTEMLEQGAPSITTIHTALVTDHGYGHSYSYFCNDFRKMKFKTPEGFGKSGRKKKRDITPALAARIQEMLDSGEYDTIPEVYNEVKQDGDYSLGDNAFYTAFKETGFKTPEYFGGKRARKKDRIPDNQIRVSLITHEPPFSIDEIVEREAQQTGRKVTRQAMDQYMEWYGLDKDWKKRRKAYLKKQREKSGEESELHEQRQEALQTLCAVIISHYIQRALQEDKPKGYAAAYYYSMQRRTTQVSLEKLEGFFEDYFAAQEGNVTKTLEELAKKQGFTQMTAQRVLKKVGLKPLGKEVISSVEKDALQRAASVAMGIIDIAYFMNTDYPFTVSYTKPYRVQRKERFGFQIGCTTTRQWIGYRHASKVYQALGEGFTPEEAQILADIHPKAYDFITQNRATIEPTIIAALQKMYNNPTHNVPYVTVELHRHLKSN